MRGKLSPSFPGPGGTEGPLEVTGLERRGPDPPNSPSLGGAGLGLVGPIEGTSNSGPMRGGMSHFFLAHYDSLRPAASVSVEVTGNKRPPNSRLSHPPGDPAAGGPGRGRGQPAALGSLTNGFCFVFFLGPSSSPRSGQPRKFCRLWAGPKWPQPRVLSLTPPRDFFTRLAAGLAFPKRTARVHSGRHQAWGRRGGGRGWRGAPSPPDPGRGDTTHSARSKPSEGIRCDGIPTPRRAGGGLRQHVRYLQSHSCGPAGSCG